MNKFTKIISVMLAVVLVIMAIPFTTFAAQKGDVDGKNGISATDARLILQVVAGLKTEADLKNADAADVDGKNGITATDARMVLQIVAGLAEAPEAPSDPEKPDSPQIPSDLTDKAAVAKFINDATAIASKNTYKWERKCAFSENIDVGGATTTLNSIINAIDENADLNSVVGGFIGVGDASGTQADAGKYALIAMKLTADDIRELRHNSAEIIIELKDSKNPSKGGNTAFNHISNDFVTKAEVASAISEVTTAITVNSLNVTFKDVKIVAKSSGGDVSLRITYEMEASMGLKAVININGTGAVRAAINYTNLKY